MKKLVSCCAILVVIGMARSSCGATVSAFSSSTLLSGTETLSGFTVDVSSSGGGTDSALVTDSNQTSDNADLNGLLNGGVDFDFQRLRFNPNDGTATLNLDITNANSDPNIRLLLGLTDVDRGESQVLMSGGSPVPASLILGAWEYHGDNSYVYPTINYDEGTGTMSEASPRPETDSSDPEPIILLDVTDLANVSINPSNNKNQVTLLAVSVPEPASFMLLALMVCALPFSRRSRVLKATPPTVVGGTSSR